MQIKHSLSIIAVLLVIVFGVSSCDKEFHNVGIDLFENYGFEIQTETHPVYIYQDQLEKVQTNGLPLSMFGEYTHPVFGKTKSQITSQLLINTGPMFGNFTQEREEKGDPDNVSVIPENETVSEVYLEIPFFTNQNDSDLDGVIDSRDIDPEDNQSDTDGDGITDLAETQSGTNPLDVDSDGDDITDDDDDDSSSYDAGDNVYEIDSLYGNRNASFNLKVKELTYYLSQLDPDENFAALRPYFSNTDYASLGFTRETLFEGNFQLDFEEIPYYYEEDDPDTEEDETTMIEGRLTPRIRVPLDKLFFQENLIDLEGEDALENLSNFQSIFKGIIIQADQFSDDLMMLLDINNAQIKVRYNYDVNNENGTTDDITDDFTETANGNFNLPLGGVTFNTIQTESGDPAIMESVLAGIQKKPSEKIYIQGGKYFANLSLFGQTATQQRDAILPIKSERRLVNQANLRLYVSDLYRTNSSLYLPERLYLYLSPSGNPLPDYAVDNTVGSGTNGDKYILSGLLQMDDSGLPSHYAFTITENINTLLNKATIEDGTLSMEDYDNFNLGLILGANISQIVPREGFLINDRGMIKYPTMGALNPFGVELFGNLAEIKAAELEVIYNATR